MDYSNPVASATNNEAKIITTQPTSNVSVSPDQIESTFIGTEVENQRYRVYVINQNLEIPNQFKIVELTPGVACPLELHRTETDSDAYCDYIEWILCAFRISLLCAPGYICCPYLPKSLGYEIEFADRKGTVTFTHSMNRHIVSLFCMCIPYQIRKSKYCKLCWIHSIVTVPGSKSVFELEEVPLKHNFGRLCNCSEVYMVYETNISVKDQQGNVVFMFRQVDDEREGIIGKRYDITDTTGEAYFGNLLLDPDKTRVQISRATTDKETVNILAAASSIWRISSPLLTAVEANVEASDDY